MLRGYKIQCPVCDLRRWYSIDAVSEVFECAGCLTKIQPSIEAPFQYRLNELVARGVDQGSLPVILTLLFLARLCRDSFLYVSGIIVQSKTETENDIDILAACDGELVFVECKDLREFAQPQIRKEFVNQLNNTIKIALQINVPIVLLSTLLQQIPENLKSQVDDWNRKYKGRLAVHILTISELERGFISIADPHNANRPRNAVLHDLMPKRTVREDGWIKEPGGRMMFF